VSRRIATSSLAAAACFVLAMSSSASAATTRIVAPGATRKVNPCTTTHPCNYIWAIQHSTSGDVVAFESGQYDYDGTVNTTDVYVAVGVTLEPAPGATTRPVIKQTVGYASCNCPVLGVDGTINGLEIDQATGTVNHASGAVDIGAGTVERSKLEGVLDGMYDTGGGHLVNSVVVADHGLAVWDLAVGKTMTLDNVTAIAHGATQGVAIEASAQVIGTTTLNITNSIARGDDLDVLSNSSTGSTDVTLHYSDARDANELAEKSGAGTARLTDTDHPMRLDPVFAPAYTEAAGSPTIDAGTADPASGTLDLFGGARTVGPAVDIGATEWQGAAPAVTTGAASAISMTAATIAGSVDPEDLTTTWHVNYGPTTAYGSRSASQTLLPGTAAQVVSSALSGLAPGTTYHYQLVAVNGRGPSAGADGTFTTTSAAPPPDTTPPAISQASLSPRSFAVSRTATAVSARGHRHRRHPPKGTAIHFTLSEAAAVTLTITQKLMGRRHGKRCIATKSKHAGKRPRCTILKTIGTLTRGSEPAGADTVAFSGRIGTRALRRGSYTLQIDATDHSGNRARPQTLKFTVVKA
jgi:hypothetical protein